VPDQDQPPFASSFFTRRPIRPRRLNEVNRGSAGPQSGGSPWAQPVAVAKVCRWRLRRLWWWRSGAICERTAAGLSVSGAHDHRVRGAGRRGAGDRLAQRLFGNPDYLLRVVAADLDAYRRIYDEQLAALPGVQRLTSTLVMKDLVGARRLPL
jgi:Lrp/AsnC ligand binding domain